MGIYTPNLNNRTDFPTHKGKRSPHRWITITPSNVGSTELPEFNEDAPRILKRQKRALGKQKGSDTDGG